MHAVRAYRGALSRALALGVPAFLLIGQGEQIVAAPATVPLLIWAARRTRSIVYRLAATAVCLATLFVVGWFVAYSAWGVGRG